MTLSIVLSAHDKGRYLDLFLFWLRRLEPEVELVLVDDGSRDDTGEIMRRWADTFIRTEDIWEVKANNVGLRAASGDHVAILQDDDFVYAEGWLGDCARFMDAQRISILSGRGTGLAYFRSATEPHLTLLRPAQGTLSRFGDGRYRLNAHLPRAEASPVWRCDETIRSPLILSRAVLDDVGLLDEAYAPAFMDDHDYCRRARRAGHAVAFTAIPQISRYCGGTRDRDDGPKKAFMDAAEARSYGIFFDRYAREFGPYDPAALAPIGEIRFRRSAAAFGSAGATSLLDAADVTPPG